MDKKIIDKKIKIEMNLADCPDCEGTGKAPKKPMDSYIEIGGVKTKKDCKRCKGIGKIPIR